MRGSERRARAAHPVASIRQNEYPDLLPDFRNLGVVARILVGVNALLLVGSFVATPTLALGVERFTQAAAYAEPLLLCVLVALYALSIVLGRLPYLWGCAGVLLVAAALATALRAGWAALGGEAPAGLGRLLAFTIPTAALLLAYLRLLARAYSPALAEARLQALQARIRPHFLFNSLNAVLAVIRRDPRQAERVIEDLADLFRTLMADARRFVRLADEIALLERYAEIEQLRLGERLRIAWELDAAPLDALLPPLVLQPLLENAVYHGVEPSLGSAEVLVRIERRGARVLARIENPWVEEQQRRSGNRVAIANIRERLALFFDAEARMEASVKDGRYCVEIDLPYRTDASMALPARPAAAGERKEGDASRTEAA
ncbi:MAG: histidine kinase [Betaproteobacteria bacterium]|nr:histidine kinase [Betaproteobacteria bacterium]